MPLMARDAKLQNEIIFVFLAIRLSLAPLTFPFRLPAIRWLNEHRYFEENENLVAGAFFQLNDFCIRYRWQPHPTPYTTASVSVSFDAIATASTTLSFARSENILYVSFHTTPPEGPLVHDVLTLFNHMRKRKKKYTKI